MKVWIETSHNGKFPGQDLYGREHLKTGNRKKRDVEDMTLESAAFTYCTLAVIAFIVLSSLFGNALVGIAIFRNARLRTLTNYFVVGLALSDFLMAFFVMTSTAMALIAEGWVLRVKSRWLCVCWATMCRLSLFSSVTCRYFARSRRS